MAYGDAFGQRPMLKQGIPPTVNPYELSMPTGPNPGLRTQVYNMQAPQVQNQTQDPSFLQRAQGWLGNFGVQPPDKKRSEMMAAMLGTEDIDPESIRSPGQAAVEGLNKTLKGVFAGEAVRRKQKEQEEGTRMMAELLGMDEDTAKKFYGAVDAGLVDPRYASEALFAQFLPDSGEGNLTGTVVWAQDGVDENGQPIFQPYQLNRDGQPVPLQGQSEGTRWLPTNIRTLDTGAQIIQTGPGGVSIDQRNLSGRPGTNMNFAGYDAQGNRVLIPAPGSPEELQVEKARLEIEKEVAAQLEKDGAPQRFADLLGAVASNYQILFENEAIVSTALDPGQNVAAFLKTTPVGRLWSQFGDTRSELARQTIMAIRPTIMNELRSAVPELSARSFDSNAELMFFLSAASDPTLTLEANIAALEILNDRFGTGSILEYMDLPEDMVETIIRMKGGMRVQSRAQAEAAGAATLEEEGPDRSVIQERLRQRSGTSAGTPLPDEEVDRRLREMGIIQ